jgi:hypothetical protein
MLPLLGYRSSTCFKLVAFFLTVLLRIILVSDQLDTQFLLKYVCLNPLHVSSNSAHPQEDGCINTTYGIITLC